MIHSATKKEGLVTFPSADLLDLELERLDDLGDDSLEFLGVAEGSLIHLLDDLFDLIGQVNLLDGLGDFLFEVVAEFLSLLLDEFRHTVFVDEVAVRHPRIDLVIEVVAPDEVVRVDIVDLLFEVIETALDIGEVRLALDGERSDLLFEGHEVLADGVQGEGKVVETQPVR